MKLAQRWDYETHKYYPYMISEEASMIEDDSSKIIVCASCGRYLRYGASYTSRQIHNAHGFGYCVCEKCYEREWDLERAALAKEVQDER